MKKLNSKKQKTCALHLAEVHVWYGNAFRKERAYYVKVYFCYTYISSWRRTKPLANNFHYGLFAKTILAMALIYGISIRCIWFQDTPSSSLNVCNVFNFPHVSPLHCTSQQHSTEHLTR